MGGDESVAGPDDENGNGSGRREEPAGASDADVRAAVESVVEDTPERYPPDRPSHLASGVPADVDPSDVLLRGGGTERPAWDDADTDPDPPAEEPGVPGEPDAGAGTVPDADADAGSDPGAAVEAEPRDGTPTVAAVGVGIGLLTIGVLVAVYHTLLATGAGRFVATLYAVGGLFVVAGFTLHALWRADEVDG